ncbi:unnamed protein product [marine sediment metagenome]|uniref:Uncharacterized protein n=1 Tax=marine sediment metagenome TaxID=412755 RepID=X1LQ47_9ZZZZ
MARLCPDEYLPWLLAHDFNLAPFDSLKSELVELEEDEFSVLLASKRDSTNLLIKYEQD